MPNLHRFIFIALARILLAFGGMIASIVAVWHFAFGAPHWLLVVISPLALGLFAVVFDWIRYVAHLDAFEGYHYFDSINKHFFIWGFTVQYIEYVKQHKKKIVAELEAMIRQPRFKSKKHYYEFSIKFGVILHPAFQMLLQKELDVLNLQKEQHHLTSRKEARLREITKQLQYEEDSFLSRTVAVVESRSSTWVDSHVADLRQQISGLPVEFRGDIEVRICRLETTTPNTRSFRKINREVEQMIALVTPREDSNEFEKNLPDLDVEIDVPSFVPESDGVAKLPQSFKWEEEVGEIIYERTFVDALNLLEANERKSVLAKLRRLAQNRYHNSLKTRRLTYGKFPNSPEKCYVSRGSEYLRFSWSKPNAVVVHYVCHRGDLKGTYKDT